MSYGSSWDFQPEFKPIHPRLAEIVAFIRDHDEWTDLNICRELNANHGILVGLGEVIEYRREITALR